MQLVFGIVALVVGIALVTLGRMSNAGTGPVAALVRNDNLAMFYIIFAMVWVVAGFAAVITGL